MDEDDKILKSSINNHEAIWNGLRQCQSFALDIDSASNFSRREKSLIPTFILTGLEYQALTYFNFEWALRFLMSASSYITALGLPVEALAMPLLIFARCAVELPLQRLTAHDYEKGIATTLENIRNTELQISQQYLLDGLAAQLKESLGLYKKEYAKTLNTEKNIHSYVKFITLILAFGMLIDPRNFTTNFLLRNIFPILQRLSSIFFSENPNIIRSPLRRLAAIFSYNKIKIEQAAYKSDNHILLNLFTLKYNRNSINEAPLLKFMLSHSPIFTVISRTEAGVIFKIADHAALQQLSCPTWDLQVRLPSTERALVMPTHSVAPERKSRSKPAAEPLPAKSLKKTDRRGPNRRTGAGVRLEQNWGKKSKPTDSAKKSNSTPKKPNWLLKYEEVCAEIIRVNSVKNDTTRIYTFGSAMVDIENESEILHGSDIDLLLIVLDSHRFIFPKNLNPLGFSASAQNNLACDYKGLKIDITVKYSPTLNPSEIIEEFLKSHDFSHSRRVLSYNKNMCFQTSPHTQACIELGVLSSYPFDALFLFKNDPYRIFRALLAIFSGPYHFLDSNMLGVLNNTEFCSEMTSRLNSTRIFWGINKLLNITSPVLMLTQLKKFGWLNRYFKESAKDYESLLARMNFLLLALKNTELEHDMAPIYALLLWPCFVSPAFYRSYNSHVTRTRAFFAAKETTGISFPGADILVIQETAATKAAESNLQTRISLLLYWLSLDFKNLQEPLPFLQALNFKLIQTYHEICRETLKNAFSRRLPRVDLSAVLKENIYRRPTPDDSHPDIGQVHDYFSSF